MRSKISVFWSACILFLSTSFLTTESLAQWRGTGWHDGPGMMGGWGMGWFGSIFMLVFWGLVIVGLVLLIRWLVHTTRKDTGPAQGGSRAVDILNERYAKGEIDREEFEQKKQDLLS